MMHKVRQSNAARTALLFWLLPCALGLGAVQYLRWTDTVWLSTAGGFWPITLTAISIAILIRLFFSNFADYTSAVAAWCTLLLAWFFGPLWATAVPVAYPDAVVAGDGRVYVARDVARYPEYKVWFLTNHRGARIVHNVLGKIVASQRPLPGEPGLRGDRADFHTVQRFLHEDPLFRHIHDVDERKLA